MIEITLYCPDDFTDAQVEFIKASALRQIEAEIGKDLVVPQETIAAVKAKTDSIRTAMGFEVPQELSQTPVALLRK